MSLGHNLGAVWDVARDLATGGYPPFVTGGPLRRGEIPVFVLHSLEPESFGRRLRFLSDNGYVTLTAAEHVECLRGTREAPERAVVLTIDDGRASVWSIGAPLLRRYGMNAVVFLVPRHLRARIGVPRPTLDDANAGSTSISDLLSIDESPSGFLFWEEVEQLSGETRIDFQSHSTSHARIHTSNRLAGFMHPGLRAGYRSLDVPLIRIGERDAAPAEIPLGTPLFESQPRLSEAWRFLEDAAVRDACLAEVAKLGDGFFELRGWEARLRKLVDVTRAKPGGTESEAEREAAMRDELGGSRRPIEEHTGREVRHICYPWHVSGPTSERLAREGGFRSAYCGKLPGVPITLSGGDPHRIARISEDYLELLPGLGRQTLTGVLKAKWSRRFGGGR